MSKVICFVSYRWIDNQSNFAQTLASRLKRYKDIDAWIDTEKLKVGDKLYTWIERGLQKDSDICIPILTPEYLESDNCLMELKYAIQLYRNEDKPILPILLSNCKIPIFLEDIIWADFRNVLTKQGKIKKAAFNSALMKLVESIRYHKNKILRISQVRRSTVRTIDDLKWHIFCRLHDGGTYKWTDTRSIFSLYCDIVLDRKFKIKPEEQFIKDLTYLMDDNELIEGNNRNIDVQYRSFVVSGVPEQIRWTAEGREFESRVVNSFQKMLL